MIAVDTSALMAILLNEEQADACILALESEDVILVSAATVAEALIVAARRNVGDEMAILIDEFGFEVVTVSAHSSRRVASAYQRWGKGIHPAALNFGDCFSYAAAKENDCPLLYVGGDFARTDIASVL